METNERSRLNAANATAGCAVEPVFFSAGSILLMSAQCCKANEARVFILLWGERSPALRCLEVPALYLFVCKAVFSCRKAIELVESSLLLTMEEMVYLRAGAMESCF